VKLVCAVLGVARSNVIDRLARPADWVDGRALARLDPAADAMIADAVRAEITALPTYGYRRAGALVNRTRSLMGLQPVNHKRMYRVMKAEGLLLPKSPKRRDSGRAHDGKVAVEESNQRWCSDGFEITCWNGDIVRAAFIIDAHDREIIAWQAVAGAGISGSMVRDMMLEAVERRFAGLRSPHPLEWLTDNGSAYTAKDTRDFATALNLVSCFTPVQSPESNGISEAFVKTFKRDYVRVNPLPDALTTLRQIAGWFEDYNENHPHSGLRMRSPREFIRAQAQ